MKYILITLLAIFTFTATSAQRHILFADAGTAIKPFPGFSLTYNYKFAKRFGAGIGIQGYKLSPTMTNVEEFTPAIFGDIRLDFEPRAKGHYFSFIDIGISLYEHNDYVYRRNNKIFRLMKDNGLYTGLGFGYIRTITKCGGGPYASLKILTNVFEPEAYNFATGHQYVSRWLSGTFAISAGFRF